MTPRAGQSSRLTAVDALRGAIMVIMALDHTRDFFHAGAMVFSPEDLSHDADPVLHPVDHAHLRAGVSLHRWHWRVSPAAAARSDQGPALALSLDARALADRHRAHSDAAGDELLARRALSRAAARPVVAGRFDGRPCRAHSLAPPCARRCQPRGTVLHNSLDGLQAQQFGAFSWLWQMLHQQGVFIAFGVPFVVAYPVLPCIALMTAGFAAAGPIFLLEPQERRKVLVRWGTALIAGFVILRAINVYGDPSPWSVQPTATFTIISFFRATKYPLSLDFVLMTIGPALLALIYLERRSLPATHPLVDHRPRAILLLRRALLDLARARVSAGLPAIRQRVPRVPLQPASVHGRTAGVVSSRLWLPAVGDLRGVGLSRPAPLSRVSLVCRTEGQAPELVVELLVGLGPAGIQHALLQACRSEALPFDV